MRARRALFSTLLLVALTASACGDSASGPYVVTGPSAEGRAVGLAGQQFDLVRLGDGDRGQAPWTMIVGSADLSDAGIQARLRESYAAGYAVSVADATQSDLDTLGQIVGHEPSMTLDREPVDLVSLQRPACEKSVRHTDVLIPPSVPGPADERDSGYVAKLLGLPPRCPEPSSAATAGIGSGDSIAQLLDLGIGYSFTGQRGEGTQAAEMQVLVYAARSFQNGVDTFYVLETGNFTDPDSPWQIQNSPPFAFPEGDTDYAIVHASPESTDQAAVTTMTSSTSENIGGTAGWDGDGPDLTVNGGYSITNSTTTQVPDLTWSLTEFIDDSLGGELWWDLTRTDISNSETIETVTGFIWQWPFREAYGGATTVQFVVTPNAWGPDGGFDVFPEVPVPLGNTFELEPPVVQSVENLTTGDSTSSGTVVVKPGEEFVIRGSGFYLDPSQEDAFVLIGGTNIPKSNLCIQDAANFKECNDSAITVVTPNKDVLPGGKKQTVVINTSEGLSNDTVTINVKD